MAPDGIVEPVNVAANGLGSLLAGVEDGPPHQLGFEGLEERLHHGVVVAVALCRHRDQDAVLAELGLIIDRTVLAATVRPSDRVARDREGAAAGGVRAGTAGCPYPRACRAALVACSGARHRASATRAAGRSAAGQRRPPKPT